MRCFSFRKEPREHTTLEHDIKMLLSERIFRYGFELQGLDTFWILQYVHVIQYADLVL